MAIPTDPKIWDTLMLIVASQPNLRQYFDIQTLQASAFGLSTSIIKNEGEKLTATEVRMKQEASTSKGTPKHGQVRYGMTLVDLTVQNCNAKFILAHHFDLKQGVANARGTTFQIKLKEGFLCQPVCTLVHSATFTISEERDIFGSTTGVFVSPKDEADLFAIEAWEERNEQFHISDLKY